MRSGEGDKEKHGLHSFPGNLGRVRMGVHDLLSDPKKKFQVPAKEAFLKVKDRERGEEGSDAAEEDLDGDESGARDVQRERFRMPPDAALIKMNIIATKKLKGVSVQDYIEVSWSDKKPMYGPFLESQGKDNVTVSEWENGTYGGDWYGELYTDRWVVTFSFMKQTFGQTLVEVKHTQQKRSEENDQCIVHIKMEMKGFPYADCFVVQVRHVASRVGDSDLSIQIGMHVEFLKSCMFEKKIRTNTGAETTKAQLALLEMILKGCAPYAKEVVKKGKFRMPPDPTLQKMDIIADRKLKGVSVMDYHEVAWLDKKPMYGPFLEGQGKNNVSVLPWETGKFKGDWCGETYAEKRIVTFNFMKQTIGQTLVEVKHTQQQRWEDNDRCIVQIKMEMKGFPYADCFVVEVRHVASHVGERDLSIQIGMSVNFLKSCMFEKKIRTNTGAETTKAQLALLEMILEGCAPYAKEIPESTDESDDDDENNNGDSLEGVLETEAADTATAPPIELPDAIAKALQFIFTTLAELFRTCLQPFVPPELFDPLPPSSVKEALRSARARVKSLKDSSLKSVSERHREDVSREIAMIEKSLDRIEEMSTTTHLS